MFQFARIRTVSRARRIALVGALAASLAGTGLVTATNASAVVPTFPDNLVVFPNRDFVMVENFQTRVGQMATVKVRPEPRERRRRRVRDQPPRRRLLGHRPGRPTGYARHPPR